jgi:hypothetical protein
MPAADATANPAHTARITAVVVGTDSSANVLVTVGKPVAESWKTQRPSMPGTNTRGPSQSHTITVADTQIKGMRT